MVTKPLVRAFDTDVRPSNSSHHGKVADVLSWASHFGLLHNHFLSLEI
jgi:hypothetical protein